MNPLSQASYVVLDAARMGAAIHEAQALQPDHVCLYKGESQNNLASVAPYLFHFEEGSEFGRWVILHGLGNAWGVFIVTQAAIEDVSLHLRKFLMVQTHEGKQLYFRFYDPRAMRQVFPVLTSGQLKDVFGIVDAWILESYAAPVLLEYRLLGNQLRVSQH